MKTKLLLTSALIAGFASSAFAHPHPTVTLGGHLDTQLGYADQDTTFDTDTPGVAGGNKLHKFSLVNDTKVHVKVDGKANNGLKYGGKIVINADTSNNKTNHFSGDGTTSASSFSNSVGYYTMAYIESARMGRGEAGTYTGAARALKVGADTIAQATGGIAGDSRFWWNPQIRDGGIGTGRSAINSFVVHPAMPSDYDTGGEDKAAKISYFSPNFKGFSFGVSYIPDTEQHGTVAMHHIVNKDVVTNGAATLDKDFFRGGYKDVFSGGIHYAGKVQKLNVKAALLGETGDAKNAASAVRHDLSAWEAGLSVGYMGWTVAGSYGDWGKSGAVKANAGQKKAQYWTLGAAYEYGAWGASVTYLDSKLGNGAAAGDRKNEFSNLSVGIDYRMAPGFMPYVEASFFDMDEKLASGSQSNSGSIWLAGTRLTF